MKKQEVVISYPVDRGQKNIVVGNFVQNALAYVQAGALKQDVEDFEFVLDNIERFRSAIALADIELHKAQQLLEEFEKEEPPPIPIKDEDIIIEHEKGKK